MGYAYMHQQTRSSLVQIMAYHLIGANPLSDPMLTHCYLDRREQNSMKF